MQLRIQQLEGHLSGGSLAPLYVITGDEPLQVREAGDAIRAVARGQGFTDRQVFDVQSGFDWGRLNAEADALSLFADRRLFDLRVPGGKLGKDGAQAIVEYVARLPGDTLLLLTLPRLERSQRQTKWFKALDGAGVVIPVWPVEAPALPSWLQRRAAAAGIQLAPDAAAFLAEQTEGNLLAAAQEIDRARLLHGAGRVSLEMVASSVSGSARYNVFELVDSAMQGSAVRSLRMLQGLRGEGTPVPVVLWSLTRELRLLEAVATEGESGGNIQRVMAAHRVWDSRKPLVGKGARRLRARDWRSLVRHCALADRAIKGQATAEPWQIVETVLVAIASGRQLHSMRAAIS